MPNKKGSTLAELCVVMALMAIIGTMIVTFTVLLADNSRQGTERLEVLGDLTPLRTALLDWVSACEKDNVKIYITSDSSELACTDGTDEGSFAFTDSEGMIVSKPFGKETASVIIPDAVESLSFDFLDSAEDILRCTVVYRRPPCDVKEGEEPTAKSLILLPVRCAVIEEVPVLAENE